MFRKILHFMQRWPCVFYCIIAYILECGWLIYMGNSKMDPEEQGFLWYYFIPLVNPFSWAIFSCYEKLGYHFSLSLYHLLDILLGLPIAIVLDIIIRRLKVFLFFKMVASKQNSQTSLTVYALKRLPFTFWAFAAFLISLFIDHLFSFDVANIKDGTWGSLCYLIWSYTGFLFWLPSKVFDLNPVPFAGGIKIFLGFSLALTLDVLFQVILLPSFKNWIANNRKRGQRMTDRQWQYRLAGVAGGLMLAAGNFFGPLSVLQLAAFVPLMMLAIRDKRPRWTALAGLYMGLAYAIPQMIYLRMPLPVTVALLFEFVIWLMALCLLAGWCMKRQTILGCFAFGACWFLLDWLNYTLIPIWGMSQSFARSWTAYPQCIGFIALTGISSIQFFAGLFQSLAVLFYVDRDKRDVHFGLILGFLMLIAIGDVWTMTRKSVGTIRVAAAGWIFDDLKKTNDPHTEEGFQVLFAQPARKAAEQGAKIFTTGEMGFYIADHNRAEWMNRFAEIAQKNNFYLLVGYFNVTADENRIFFMNPQGEIEAEYTKTHLTPFEHGKKGNGNLQTINVNGVKVGAMICQDDNFNRLTRYYGRFKTPLVLCPTADWGTIKNAHLQAVRARAIECQYAIARGAANGISAIISPTGEVLAKLDHYQSGPGFVIADVPLYENITFFSRFGHMPMLMTAGLTLAFFIYQKYPAKKVNRA
jgi:apolipoprotein N-acyltransferase